MCLLYKSDIQKIKTKPFKKYKKPTSVEYLPEDKALRKD
jgi:hypothetical protein